MSALETSWTTPPTLKGQRVTLRPLLAGDAAALVEAAREGELWNLWYTSVPSPDTVEAYVDLALTQQARGESLSFAVLDARGEVVGSTRFCQMLREHRRVEIGYTWYARRVQRTGLNTEAKRLLLAHAFEVLDCLRVELRTHWHNRTSRAAIERLGARLEGVLRQHVVMPDGTLRDSVVYSILDREWPTVRTHLDFELGRREGREDDA